ncbi:unnamed protein product [Closterium sp. NIES-54]
MRLLLLQLLLPAAATAPASASTAPPAAATASAAAAPAPVTAATALLVQLQPLLLPLQPLLLRAAAACAAAALCCCCYCPAATTAAAAARATAVAGGGAAGGAGSAAGAGGAGGVTGSAGGAAGAGGAGPTIDRHCMSWPLSQQLQQLGVDSGGGGGFGFLRTAQRQQQSQQETFSPQVLSELFPQRCVTGSVEAAALGASELAVALGASESAAALGASECAAAFGARASPATGPSSAEALHTFTLDSGASRCFFCDCTTLTPLAAPVPVSLADPTGGPVVTRASTVLPCPAVPSGSLSGLHLPTFLTNLVSNAAIQDVWVDTFIPGGQRVAICTCSRTGRHLATFTRQPGSSPYTLTTASAQVAEAGQVAASNQVSASGQLAASCSCQVLSQQTLLWHHRLGHPSLPRLRSMHSRLLVSGLPRCLPSLPCSPAPPFLPCVEGRQRAAPHSSNFPPTTASLQTLHMDVWGLAPIGGMDQERYFLLVVDDYTRYTTVFPLRPKADVSGVLIPWIRATRRQLRERFSRDFPVLCLHSNRGGDFSSDLLAEFCRDEGIVQSFTLLASPKQNGIVEHHIGLIMEVAHTSMIHAVAPHFLWPFAIRYAAHQLNLWPRVSEPETSPTLRWTGKVGDVSVFRVWGALSLFRNAKANKLSSCTLCCVFLGFPTDAPPWQFYHPRSRRVFSSQDVTFDESVCYYRLHPHASHPGPAPSGVSQVDPPLLVEPLEISSESSSPAEGGDPAADCWCNPTVCIRLVVRVRACMSYCDYNTDDTAATHRSPRLETPPGFPPWPSSPPPQPAAVESGAETAGAKPGGAATGGATSRGATTRGAGSWGAAAGGANSRGPASPSGGGAVCDPARGSPSGGGYGPAGAGAYSPGGTAGAGGTGGTAGGARGAAGAGGTRGAAGAGSVGATSPRGATGAGGIGPTILGGTAGARGAGDAVGAGGTGAGGAGVAGPGGARTGGAGAARASGDVHAGGVGAAGAGGTSGAGGAGGVTGAAGTRGAGGARAGGTGGTRGARPAKAGGAAGAGGATGAAGTGGAGAAGAGVAGAAGAGVAGAAGTALHIPFFYPQQQSSLPPHESVLRQVLSLPSSTGLPLPLLCPPTDQSRPQLLPGSPTPAPAPHTEVTESLTERREPESRASTPVRARRVARPCPPAVPGTHGMALRPSFVPQRVVLPEPPASSLHAVPDPNSDLTRAASPNITRLFATVVTDPDLESTAAFSLVTELVDFAARSRLDYVTSLVTESESLCPPSVGGELALGNPDALDIPTPRSYVDAIAGEYSSQWQTAMDAKMASWKSTGTYVVEVLPPGANIVDGMWVFRVKRAPGSPPAFKAHYVARGFSQRQAVDFVHTFSPTPKMTTLRVLLHVAAERDYELHSLEFCTAFLQGSLHEEIWLRRPPGFTESFPPAPPLDESVELSGPYLELVGCLMYLMTCTRPDLAYPLSLLVPYVAPGRHRKVHWEATKWVLRYLCITSAMGLVLEGQRSLVLTRHSDASWADDQATQDSSQGYTFSLGSDSVSWRSTRSSSMLSFCCEAEIYAGAMAAQELRWLTYLLTDLGERPLSPPVLYVDNKAMLTLCHKQRLEHRTKHIALRYFLARELQQRRQLRLSYVASWANTADVFTKALGSGDHQRFCTALGLVLTLPHLLVA